MIELGFGYEVPKGTPSYDLRLSSRISGCARHLSPLTSHPSRHHQHGLRPRPVLTRQQFDASAMERRGFFDEA
jgi:hypothetical protein